MEKHRLKELADALKMSIVQLEKEIDVNPTRLGHAIRRNSKITMDIVIKIIDRFPDVNKEWLLDGKGGMFKESSLIMVPHHGAADEAQRIRNQKAFGPHLEKGIRFVPIKLQAGYALHYTDSLYLEQLERVFIPGMPYEGEKFRIFEVEGDSMEPTLQEGFYMIAEKVEPENYQFTSQFYIYAIVTETQMLIKRLYRKDDGNYVMISDNEEYYQQKPLLKEDIKELWLVKRKMDWNMPPPRKFEIKI